jgi:hypothetical protein
MGIQKKVFLIFSIIILFSVLSACGSSPAKTYAKEMEPIVDKLTKWQESSGTVISQVFSDQSTYFYNYDVQVGVTLAQYPVISDQSEFRSRYPRLYALKDSAIAATSAGKEILDVMNVITPPSEIEAAHNYILGCIKSRTTVVESISIAFSTLSPLTVDDSISARDCDSINAAISKVIQFVADN